jgi:hypothetical protein
MDGELNALPHIFRIEFDSPNSRRKPENLSPGSVARRHSDHAAITSSIVSYVIAIGAAITNLTKSNPKLLNVPAAKVARATISFLKRKRTWL